MRISLIVAIVLVACARQSLSPAASVQASAECASAVGSQGDDTTQIMSAVGAQLCKDFSGVRLFGVPIRCPGTGTTCSPVDVVRRLGGDSLRLPRYAEIARVAAGGQPCHAYDCPAGASVRLELSRPEIFGDSAIVRVEAFPKEGRTSRSFSLDTYEYRTHRVSPSTWSVPIRSIVRQGHYQIP